MHIEFKNKGNNEADTYSDFFNSEADAFLTFLNNYYLDKFNFLLKTFQSN